MKTLKYYMGIVGILSSLFVSGQHNTIYISEVMPGNKNCIVLENGKTPDWIELYNSSDESISLNGWSITDNPNKTRKFVFPDIKINPKGFLLIYAMDDESGDESHIYTNFELKANEEPVLLFNDNSELIDSVSAECIPADHSLGRINNTGDLVLFKLSTPGYSNNKGQQIILDYITDVLESSHNSGFYEEVFNLNLSSGYAGNTIYYTLDGTQPDEYSLKYCEPIHIYNRSGEKNKYSAIEIAPNSYVPNQKVFKGTTLRAVVFSEGCPASDELTRTYFVDESMKSRYHVPVVSIIAEPDDFFDDDEGIYIQGNDWNALQRGKDWEREVRFEYFSPTGEVLVSQNVGVRIHGRGSRMGIQKSLKIYAREEYGKDIIEHKFFEHRDIDKYKTLILRTVTGDWSNTMFTDDICHALVRDMDMDYMETQPVVMFLNGEYWGIHNLRERQDEYYLKEEFDDGIQLSVVSHEQALGPIVESGDAADYNLLVDFLSNTDLNIQENYEELKNRIDIDNAIDYFIAELYFANADFPDLNCRMWKTEENESMWRWFFFDCDGCLWRVNHDLLFQYSNINEEFTTYPQWALVVFKQLMTNVEFRTRFYQRFMVILNTDFSTHKIIQTVNEFEENYKPLVNEQIARWGEPTDHNKWLKDVEELRGFAVQRPAEIIDQLSTKMGTPFKLERMEGGNRFSIQFGEQNEVPFDIKVYDSVGRLINEYSSGVNSSYFQIDTDLPVGLYYIQVTYGNINYTEKYLSL